MQINDHDYISEHDFNNIWGAEVKSNGELYSYQEAIGLPTMRVWTVYEDDSIDDDGCSDNNWYAMPGMAPSLALGYLITEKPWDEDTRHAIWYLDDDKYAREERRIFLLENL